MKSLFNPPDNQEIINRINRFSANSKAGWGKMSADQVLRHLQQPLKVAFGELKLKRSLVGILIGRMILKNLTKDEKPFGKNAPTDKNFIIKDRHKVEAEKKELIALVQKFVQLGPSGISKDPHPFFGKMTSQEWDRLQWKHLDHHLRQFGV